MFSKFGESTNGVCQQFQKISYILVVSVMLGGFVPSFVGWQAKGRPGFRSAAADFGIGFDCGKMQGKATRNEPREEEEKTKPQKL